MPSRNDPPAGARCRDRLNARRAIPWRPRCRPRPRVPVRKSSGIPAERGNASERRNGVISPLSPKPGSYRRGPGTRSTRRAARGARPRTLPHDPVLPERLGHVPLVARAGSALIRRHLGPEVARRAETAVAVNRERVLFRRRVGAPGLRSGGGGPRCAGGHGDQPPAGGTRQTVFTYTMGSGHAGRQGYFPHGLVRETLTPRNRSRGATARGRQPRLVPLSGGKRAPAAGRGPRALCIRHPVTARR